MAEMRADGGSSGVELGAHASGNPFPGGNAGFEANITVGHTYVIILAALAILWLMGGGVFRKIRM